MYVDRDSNGNIVATYSRPQRDGHEFVDGAKLAVKGHQEIRDLYAAHMNVLSSRYTQQEINTFHRKSIAADAYKAGTATVSQIMYLAKIDGRINGELPTTPAESEDLYDSIQADPAQKLLFDAGVLMRADRVIQVSHTFDYYTGEIERLRDKRILELSDSSDNAPIVAALKADYDALTAAYLAAV